MKALYLSLSLVLCAVLFGAASGCVVDFPDELPYGCETDADCGGKGYVCTSLPDQRHYCCLPATEECNKLDDDCNGQVDDLKADPCYSGTEATRNVGACRTGKPACGDGNIRCVGEVLPTTEVCNGKDDDCDGQVDEGFNFQTGHDNCGRCDQVCTALEDCVAGQCTRKREIVCDNNQDDDSDTKVDCADTDCASLPCGEGCTCIGGKKSETECNNQKDDDGDSLVDCLDPDCDSRSCGPGCLCLNLVKGEGDCVNLAADNSPIDDEADGAANCADSDCSEKSCGDGCFCRGGVKAEDLCDDALDNDGDTKTDCADATDCNGKLCGVGCLCQGGLKREANCADGLDNDGNGLIDCADAACDTQTCSTGGTGASCFRRQCKETNCTDTIDNDRDSKPDCQDTDCEGVVAGTDKVCTVANGPQEVNCTNGKDDDGDALKDCQNNGMNQPEPNCLNGVCGVGCQYNNTAGGACNVKVEVFCDDATDNDGDSKTDCPDTDCNGKSCNYLGGCTCNGTAKAETICYDGISNDGDSSIDCADADCNGKFCSADNGCVCNGTTKKETTCNDNVDNDGDNKKDCADPDCVGQPCNATGGTCSNATPSVCQ